MNTQDDRRAVHPQRAGAFVAAIVAVCVSIGAMGCAVDPDAPLATDGVLDLSHWNFETRGNAPLDGDWSVCWSAFVSPETAACPSADDGAWSTVPVKGLWSEDAVPSPFGGRGIATYRLRVRRPSDSGPLFLLAGSPLTAHRTFIDGEMRGGSGRVGTTPETTVADTRNRVYDLPSGSAEILIQVDIANFVFRGGGIRRPWLIGPPDRVQTRIGLDILREAVLGIVATVVGLAFLLQFALRPTEQARGYFALFGLVIGLRVIPASISDLSQIVAPALSFEALMRGEYLGTSLAIFAAAGYFSARVSGVMPPRWVRILQLTALAVGFIALAAPISMVGETLVVALVLPPLLMITVLISYGRAYRRGVAGTRPVLVATIAYAIVVAHDLTRIQFGFGLPLELFPYFFIIWVLSEGGGLLRTFFASFSIVERLTGELQDSNFELQETESAVVRFVPFDLLRLLGKNSIDEIEPGDRTDATMTVLYVRVHSAAGDSADQSFRLLQTLLQQIEPILQHAGGYVSHQSTGSLMGLFPGELSGGAASAIGAAIEMEQTLLLTAQRSSARISLGVATGRVVIGTIGTSQQLSSSVVGAPVDQAQRLEALTRQYQVGLLVAGSTHDALGERAGTPALREVGELVLEPSSERIRLFTTGEGDLADE